MRLRSKDETAIIIKEVRETVLRLLDDQPVIFRDLKLEMVLNIVTTGALITIDIMEGLEE